MNERFGRASQVKDRDGVILIGEIDRWAIHFPSVRPELEEIDDLPIIIDSLSINEIKAAIRRFKNNKTADINNVSA